MRRKGGRCSTRVEWKDMDDTVTVNYSTWFRPVFIYSDTAPPLLSSSSPPGPQIVVWGRYHVIGSWSRNLRYYHLKTLGTVLKTVAPMNVELKEITVKGPSTSSHTVRVFVFRGLRQNLLRWSSRSGPQWTACSSNIPVQVRNHTVQVLAGVQWTQIWTICWSRIKKERSHLKEKEVKSYIPIPYKNRHGKMDEQSAVGPPTMSQTISEKNTFSVFSCFQLGSGFPFRWGMCMSDIMKMMDWVLTWRVRQPRLLK